MTCEGIDYETLYRHAQGRQVAWALAAGARYREEAEDAVSEAWTKLLAAGPTFETTGQGMRYLHIAIVNTLRRHRRRRALWARAVALAPPVPQAADERAIWALAAQLPGWVELSERERLAVVLLAAGWPTKEIAALAPRLYPRPASVADAAWRGRLRLQSAMGAATDDERKILR